MVKGKAMDNYAGPYINTNEGTIFLFMTALWYNLVHEMCCVLIYVGLLIVLTVVNSFYGTVQTGGSVEMLLIALPTC